MIRSILDFIFRFMGKMRDDFISAFSSQAAFFIIVSFFPFILFLLTILHYLPISEHTLIFAIEEFFPVSIRSFLVSTIKDLNAKASGTVISITVIATLWSAARGFLAIIRGLNGVYRIRETRNYFLLRAVAAIYTVIFTIVILISLGILVFGNRITLMITTRFPILSELALGIISLRTIVGICVLLVFFTCLYVFIPNRKTKIINELPGALIAATGWMLFSYAYSYYIDNMGNFSYMYGSLAAIVLCMLWVYFCMYIMFIGAEINVVLQNKEMLNDFQNIKNEFKNKSNK